MVFLGGIILSDIDHIGLAFAFFRGRGTGFGKLMLTELFAHLSHDVFMYPSHLPHLSLDVIFILPKLLILLLQLLDFILQLVRVLL